MKKIIHVNQHKIRHNTKHKTDEPVLTVKTYKENNYAHIHDHIQTDIAGVYYFQLAEDDKDQAELFFVSPLPNDSSYQSVKAKQGELLLFPGWLKHGVTTHMSSDDRVSFSFNLKMR